MLKSWVSRIIDIVLGPLARAAEQLADDEALLALTPRAIEAMPKRHGPNRHGPNRHGKVASGHDRHDNG